MRDFIIKKFINKDEERLIILNRFPNKNITYKKHIIE